MKKYFWSYIFGLVLVGISIPLMISDVLSFTYIEEIPLKYKSYEVTSEYKFGIPTSADENNKFLFYIDAEDFEIVYDETLDNEVLVKYTFYKIDQKVEIDKYPNEIHIYTTYSFFSKEFLKIIIDNLKERKVYDYHALMKKKVAIYINPGVEKNIEIIQSSYLYKDFDDYGYDFDY